MRVPPPPRPPSLGPDAEGGRAPLSGRREGGLVWLARHARVHPDWGAKAYGDLDVPLSEDGERESSALGARLARAGATRVLASPLARARHLGEVVAAAAGLELALDERLVEVHRGEWQALPRVEYAERWSAQADAYWRDPWRWRGNGGESDEALTARVWPALAAALPAAGETLVLCAHFQVVRALCAAALGLHPARSHALRLEPARATLLRDGREGWTLVRSNTAHPDASLASRPG